jgi:hypothetical protein
MNLSKILPKNQLRIITRTPATTFSLNNTSTNQHMDLTSSPTLPNTFITRLPMNHLDKKDRKIAKKLRQQVKKKALAKESNERDTEENISETETFSAVQNPNKTALQDSYNGNIASETNRNIKGFEGKPVHEDDKNQDLPKLKNKLG